MHSPHAGGQEPKTRSLNASTHKHSMSDKKVRQPTRLNG